MESGKTTLTTGLVRAGFCYLTDEAVSFDWETGVIEPFPKPLSIDPGSWFLFPELEPPPPPGEHGTSGRPVAGARGVRSGPMRVVGRPCRARFVVFPRTTTAPTRR